MTVPLPILSGPSDLIASVSLGVLATIFGILRADRVMPMYLRKRGEFALIFALACLHRFAEWRGALALAFGLHIASAVVSCLSASAAVIYLIHERRHGA